MSKRNRSILGLGFLGVIVGVIYAMTRTAKAAGSIVLKEGWNEVKYTGTRQKVDIAFQSIEPYVLIVYYLSGISKQWVQLVTGDFVEPNMSLNIKVRQSCIWTF